MIECDSLDSHSKRESQVLCRKLSMRDFNWYLYTATLPHSIELKLKQCSLTQLMEQSTPFNVTFWPENLAICLLGPQTKPASTQKHILRGHIFYDYSWKTRAFRYILALLLISVRQFVCPISRALLHEVNTRELSIPLPRQQKFQYPTPTLVPQADTSFIHPHPMQGIVSRPFLPVPPFNGNILSVSKFVFLQTWRMVLLNSTQCCSKLSKLMMISM